MSEGHRRKTGLMVLVAALLVGLASPIPSFAGGRQETGQTTLSVFVSILPQAYFVERIGAGRVKVEAMVSPGQNPHSFEPTPQQMARLAEAKAFFRIGVEFENSLIPRIQSTMKGLEMVDCREGLQLRRMEAHEDEHEEEEHEAEEHHEHEGTDPHIWLSVRNAIQISTTIHRALIRLDPQGKTVYDQGYQQLVGDLRVLDQRLAGILAPVKGKPFFVFHPAFGYFADDYGLEQIAVETGGVEPSARELSHLIAEAREKGVRVVFVQPQFSRKSAETIAAEIGGAVVPLDPLSRDYIENLERIARAVQEGLKSNR